MVDIHKQKTPILIRNPAFLLIDMQQYYLQNLYRRDRDRLIDSHIEVLYYCVENDFPVIVLEHNIIESRTVKCLRNVINQVPTNYYISKDLFDGFSGTNLDSILRELSVPNICIMGLYTPECINHTSKTASELGYGVHTAESLIYDKPWVLEELFFRQRGLYFKHHSELLESIVR